MATSLTGLSPDQIKAAASAGRTARASAHLDELRRSLLRSLRLFPTQYQELTAHGLIDDYAFVRASEAAAVLDRQIAEGTDAPRAWEAAHAVLVEDLTRWETGDATAIDPDSGGYR